MRAAHASRSAGLAGNFPFLAVSVVAAAGATLGSTGKKVVSR